MVTWGRLDCGKDHSAATQLIKVLCDDKKRSKSDKYLHTASSTWISKDDPELKCTWLLILPWNDCYCCEDVLQIASYNLNDGLVDTFSTGVRDVDLSSCLDVTWAVKKIVGNHSRTFACRIQRCIKVNWGSQTLQFLDTSAPLSTSHHNHGIEADSCSWWSFHSRSSCSKCSSLTMSRSDRA